MTTKEAEAYILFKMLDMRPDDWWNYVVVDECGIVCVFEERPEVYGSVWGLGSKYKFILHVPEYISCWDTLIIKLNLD